MNIDLVTIFHSKQKDIIFESLEYHFEVNIMWKELKVVGWWGFYRNLVYDLASLWFRNSQIK